MELPCGTKFLPVLIFVVSFAIRKKSSCKIKWQKYCFEGENGTDNSVDEVVL